MVSVPLCNVISELDRFFSAADEPNHMSSVFMALSCSRLEPHQPVTSVILHNILFNFTNRKILFPGSKQSLDFYRPCCYDRLRVFLLRVIISSARFEIAQRDLLIHKTIIDNTVQSTGPGLSSGITRPQDRADLTFARNISTQH